MNIHEFLDLLDSDFYVGVPDSQLKALCNYLNNRFGQDVRHHIIAANEGNAVAIAAGHYLATGKVAVVYMQNSGEGNIVNPVASLLNENVYAIPVIFIVGWRGEPGVKDEPQHAFQGIITKELLDVMNIPSFVIHKDTENHDIKVAIDSFRKELDKGNSVAFIVGKNGLTYDSHIEYSNDYDMKREDVIRKIVEVSEGAPIISTTGKTSRELFEIREEKKQGHANDFLTVGSMGHSSSIALGIALEKPEQKVWCIDGDGAAIMHMGAIPVIGATHPSNLIHIIINNGAHESVGGMPTCAKTINFANIAMNCGYDYSATVDTFPSLEKELELASTRKGLSLIEIHTAIGSRKDLGRPTTKPKDNKEHFMTKLLDEI